MNRSKQREASDPTTITAEVPAESQPPVQPEQRVKIASRSRLPIQRQLSPHEACAVPNRVVSAVLSVLRTCSVGSSSVAAQAT